MFATPLGSRGWTGFEVQDSSAFSNFIVRRGALRNTRRDYFRHVAHSNDGGAPERLVLKLCYSL